MGRKPTKGKKSKHELNPLDFWARGEKTKRWYHICEGTGDGMSNEDFDAEYVDYIYYDIFDCLGDVYEQNVYDGGMVLLRKRYRDMTLKQVVLEVECMGRERLVLID